MRYDVKETLLEKAKRCFKRAQEAEAKQRVREQEDLRFQVPELQWDEASRRQRAGGDQGGGQIVPPRPVLSISKLDQPIQLVFNQARQAKLGVNIHPVSEDADKDTAEVLQGLYRRIEQDSCADDARLWALDRAIKVGRGAYLVTSKYDEDAPDTFDQEIVIERILHQDSVYFDPAAQKPDCSDGEWAFMVAWVELGTFRRMFPKATASNCKSDQEWASLQKDEPDWVRGSGETAAVRVANYWYKRHEEEVITVGKQTRRRDRVRVYLSKLTGHEVLEDEDTDGQYIPLIPVIGRELQPFDSERRYTGMIGNAKDGQRLYNFAASSLVERMAMEPKTPFLGYVGQFETDKAKWETINTRNWPYVESDTINVDGKPAPLPQRAQLDQTGMSLAMMALQEADSFIQSATSVYDPSLGRSNPRDESGRAKMALQDQSDAATSHFLSNLAAAMRYEARVVLDWVPAKYDRPGRVISILGGEDEIKTVMLNAPYAMDPNGKTPMQAEEGQQGAKMHDVRTGTYGIDVNIGKSFQTRLQEGGEMIGQILQAQPDLMPLVGPTYFRFQDWPGAEELADILKKLRDKQYPGLGDDKDGPTAEQAAAKAQALEQQLQELQKMYGQAVDMLKTEKVKHDAQVQSDQLKATSQVEIARMNNATKLAVARITAAKASLDAVREDEEEAIALAQEHQHEREMQTLDMAHEVGMAAGGANTTTMTREGGQETGQEREAERSGEQASESAPPEATE